MADHIVTLTEDQEIALEYEVTRVNEQRAGMAVPIGMTVTPITGDQLLNETVGMRLDGVSASVEATVKPLLEMIEDQTDPVVRDAIVNSIRNPAIKRAIDSRLAAAAPSA